MCQYCEIKQDEEAPIIPFSDCHYITEQIQADPQWPFEHGLIARLSGLTGGMPRLLLQYTDQINTIDILSVPIRFCPVCGKPLWQDNQWLSKIKPKTNIRPGFAKVLIRTIQSLLKQTSETEERSYLYRLVKRINDESGAWETETEMAKEWNHISD